MLMNIDDIVALLPHGEKMVLIEEVISWDEESIVCQSRSHHRDDNPLLDNGKLPTTACIEYGAQAMALHEAICFNKDGMNGSAKPLSGVISALKDVSLSPIDLSDLEESLVISANRMMASAKGAIYRFEVKAGNYIIASGRITVNH